jgi:hypothetical protein
VATLTYQALPTSFALLGSGSYCEGQPGAELKLGGSQPEVGYQLLLNHSLNAGNLLLGSGDTLNFGYQSLSGTYTVLATINGCSLELPDSIVVQQTICTNITELKPRPYIFTDTEIQFQNPQPEVNLYDLTGRLILFKENIDFIPITYLPSGIYVVSCSNDLIFKLIRP